MDANPLCIWGRSESDERGSRGSFYHSYKDRQQLNSYLQRPAPKISESSDLYFPISFLQLHQTLRLVPVFGREMAPITRSAATEQA